MLRVKLIPLKSVSFTASSLKSQKMIEQADVNRDDVVNFFDISP